MGSQKVSQKVSLKQIKTTKYSWPVTRLVHFRKKKKGEKPNACESVRKGCPYSAGGSIRD